MQEAREFGESRDAKVSRLSDEIHVNRGEVTHEGRRPQAIGADAADIALDGSSTLVATP
jgi:hypothetical protein